MNIREMRTKLGDTQSEFASRYNIPFRTIQNWETGLRKPPEYIISLLENRIRDDLVNRKTVKLPQYNPHKKNLPRRSEYVGSLPWLKAVCECVGENIVFVWAYGNHSLAHYNGIVILGNKISSYCVKEKNGIQFTDFNRTLSDAFANEAILDLQGITEALSKYYYTNNESFNGISVAPEYQERLEALANEAIKYYC